MRMRLEPEEIKALKFAGHRQLSRWAKKRQLSPRYHSMRTALIRAVHKLDEDARGQGFELRAIGTGEGRQADQG